MDMTLSDEQMACVTGAGVDNWHPIDLPAGRQQLPAWVRGAHVDWHHGYASAPSVRLKTNSEVRHWADKRFALEGSKLFIARHDDGRAECYYQGGGLHKDTVKRFRTLDGNLHAYRPSTGERITEQRDGYTINHVPPDPGEWVDVERMCTRQENGFGGSHIDITLVDGTPATLRGPWHGGAPAGHVEVSYVDMTCSYSQGKFARSRPWHQIGGRGGLYITESLFLSIVATHAPHVRAARVTHSYGPRTELYRQEWGASKNAIYELERGRAGRMEPAGEFWPVYWDSTGGYCGGLRIPTYGYQPGVVGPKAEPRTDEAVQAVIDADDALL